MFYSEISIKFGCKYDENIIPKGEYCYNLDDDKNRKDLSLLYIKPCPYYKTMGKVFSFSQYLVGKSVFLQ